MALIKQLVVSLSLLAYTGAYAQTLVKGDMNSDGVITIADVSSLTATLLGEQDVQVVNIKCDPNTIDNSYLANTWNLPLGEILILNEDGSASSSRNSEITKFVYYPYARIVVFFDKEDKVLSSYTVLVVNEKELVLKDDKLVSYGKHNGYATHISLPAKIDCIVNTESRLNIEVDPEESSLPILEWTSSDNAIAYVDVRGSENDSYYCLIASKGGSCTITAKAINEPSISLSFTAVVIQPVDAITLNQEALKMEPGASYRLIASILPENVTSAAFHWDSSDSSIAEISPNGVVYAIADGVCTISAIANDGSGKRATCNVTVGNINDDHSYIDLGLPSGTQWATCNIGATSETKYGNYFAFAETETKNSFAQNNYKYYDEEQKILKYNSNPDLGIVDNKSILEPGDDAATFLWGEDWKIPSNDQWQELIDNCTYSFVQMNGVYGGKFTAPNGNYIFLPAAGLRNDSGPYDAGICCNYACNQVDGRYSLCTYFKSYQHNMSVYGRQLGYPIRPVHSVLFIRR